MAKEVNSRGLPGIPSYDQDETEYGGRGGLIQSSADGHVDLTARENRMVHRIWGSRTAGLMELPEGDLHYQDVNEIRQELPVRTHGRGPDEQPTDQLA